MVWSVPKREGYDLQNKGLSQPLLAGNMNIPLHLYSLTNLGVYNG